MPEPRSKPNATEQGAAFPDYELAAAEYRDLVPKYSNMPDLDTLDIHSKQAQSCIANFRKAAGKSQMMIGQPSGTSFYRVLTSMSAAGEWLIAYEGIDRSLRGNWKGGLEDATLIEKMSRHVGQVRSGYPISVELETTALKTWWKVLKYHAEDPKALRAAGLWLDEMPENPIGDLIIDRRPKENPAGDDPIGHRLLPGLIPPTRALRQPPDINKAQIWEEDHAYRWAARAALAVLEFRHEHGEFPDTLPLLPTDRPPSVPRPLSTGQPKVGYDHSKTHFVVSLATHKGKSWDPPLTFIYDQRDVDRVRQLGLGGESAFKQ